MGLFSKLFNSAPSESDGKFEDQYNRLKEICKEITKYEYVSDSVRYEKYDEIYPLTEEFISIAESIDEGKANARIKKEAKQMHPKDPMPYHDDFRKTVFRDGNFIKEITSNVKGIQYKIKRVYDGIESFKAKYDGIPYAKIELSDEPVRRNNMINMPEIKYSPVGKSFNKERLVKFIVIDTETTGLKASNNRIIQLSAVKYVEFEPVEIWNTYIDPLREIPADASKVNGITDDMVKGKPTIKQVAKSFTEFVEKWDVVGYNLPFDMRFLYAEGIDLTETKRKYYDVLPLAKKAFKDNLEHFTLSDVASHCRVYFPAHNSLNDCFATAEVFEKVIDEIIE